MKFALKNRFSNCRVFEILEKVALNRPLVYSKKIDVKVLEGAGIKLDRPVFIEEEKNINLSYVKALWIAKNIRDFSLIIFSETRKNLGILTHFFGQDFRVLNPKDLGKSLKENMLGIDINNGEKMSSYSIEKNELLLDFNYQSFSRFQDYFLKKIFSSDKVSVEVRQTYFYGNYYFFNAYKKDENNIKIKKINKKVKIKLKNIIKSNVFDYFYIEKEKNYYVIKSVINKIQYYLFSLFMPISVEIHRIKNHVKGKSEFFLETEFVLDFSKNITELWVYFGEEKILSALEFSTENLYRFLADFIQSFFSLKVICEDKKLSDYFNNYLPRRVVLEGVYSEQKNVNFISKSGSDTFVFDNNLFTNELRSVLNNLSFEDLILCFKNKKLCAKEVYFLLKNKFLIQKDDVIILNENELQNYILQLFFDNSKKVISVKKGASKKLVVGGITYYNCKTISEKTLQAYDSFDFVL